MRRPDWFEGAGPRGARRALLRALSWLYGLGARLHQQAYARGWAQRRRLGCKVVSVGNLVAGGAGKTPTAAWIAAALRARGHRVALASRGYGSGNREPVRVVSDGTHVHDTSDAGEEALLLAALAPGVPVLVGARRDLVGQRAIAAFDTHILVLDDGFQHHRLERDIDLVTVHGSGGFGNRELLPFGPLRERPDALGRADAVGIVDGPLSEADEALVNRFATRAMRFEVERRPAGTRPLAGGPLEPAAALAGRSAGLICGLARPKSFRETVESLGIEVVAERAFPDHHPYRAADLRGLAEDAPLWLTTEKDAGKLLPRWAPDVELRVLVLETRVVEGSAFIDWIEDRLRAKASGRSVALPPASSPPRGRRDHDEWRGSG